MGGLVKRIVMSIVGMVLVLGFWTIQGKCSGPSETPVVTKIPSKVWEGGGGKCKLEVEVSDPSTVHLEFYNWADAGPHKNQSFHAQEAIPPGKHMFLVEVPRETNVSPELHMDKTQIKKGSKMAWVLTCGEKECYRYEETFEQDPKPGDEFWFNGHTVPEAGTGEGW